MLTQALTIAVGVALGTLLAVGIAVATWLLFRCGYVATVARHVAASVVARYRAVRRAWLQIVLGGFGVVTLAFVGSPVNQHAPNTSGNFEAVLPDPTFSRSLQSSFESNVIGSAFLMGSDAISAMGNKTPVNDAEIEDRISREKLDTYVGQFTSIRTQGELDAKVDRIRRQEFNKRVGEAGGGQALVTDLIAGAAGFVFLLGLWRLASACGAGRIRPTGPPSPSSPPGP